MRRSPPVGAGGDHVAFAHRVPEPGDRRVDTGGMPTAAGEAAPGAAVGGDEQRRRRAGSMAEADERLEAFVRVVGPGVVEAGAPLPDAVQRYHLVLAQPILHRHRGGQVGWVPVYAIVALDYQRQVAHGVALGEDIAARELRLVETAPAPRLGFEEHAGIAPGWVQVGVAVASLRHRNRLPEAPVQVFTAIQVLVVEEQQRASHFHGTHPNRARRGTRLGHAGRGLASLFGPAERSGPAVPWVNALNQSVASALPGQRGQRPNGVALRPE